jgi:hypothetical protein
MATRACSVLIEPALLKRIAIDATPATILIWPAAMNAARRVIDNALNPKKQKLGPPT